METLYHIVEFEHYCPTCEYKEEDETGERCQRCLEVPARENSRKPECYKEKSKIRG